MKKYLLLLTLLCCSCSNEVYEYEYIYENVDVNAYEIRFELNENEYQKFSYNSSLSSLENQELLKQYIENRNIYYTQMESKYNYIISAKPSITDKSFNKIQEELFQNLNKCGMIINE